MRIAVDLRARWREFHLDLRPISVEFLRQNQRQGGQDALPHFRRRAENRHRIVGTDGDPGIDLRAWHRAERLGNAGHATERKRERQRGRAFNEAAPADGRGN